MKVKVFVISSCSEPQFLHLSEHRRSRRKSVSLEQTVIIELKL